MYINIKFNKNSLNYNIYIWKLDKFSKMTLNLYISNTIRDFILDYKQFVRWIIIMLKTVHFLCKFSLYGCKRNVTQFKCYLKTIFRPKLLKVP